MAGHGAGAEEAVGVFAAYPAAERELGRIAANTDLDAVAALLVGACFQEAILDYYSGGVYSTVSSRETAAGPSGRSCARCCSGGPPGRCFHCARPPRVGRLLPTAQSDDRE